ncbi:MAG: NADP-dependent oxidoreductase [Quisquiliibacterium sp.]
MKSPLVTNQESSAALSQLINHQVRLAARPVGLPTMDNWQLTTEPVMPPGNDGIVVAVEMISLDPAMRGWMNEGRSYIAPVGLGDVMRAGALGKIIASSNSNWQVGDYVTGTFGVQQYCTLVAEKIRVAGVSRIDPALAPLSAWLNALGMPGMTGYFGLLEVGQPKPGETVVVSGAAGAVGQMVGQVARIHGCRVVGIAGGKAKCDFVVDELGFDACIDYKAGSVREGLKRDCPQGVDIYFDNVGGDILDTLLTRINMRARIVICGAISQYNATQPVQGPKNYLSLLVNRARMEGIVVFDWAARFPEAVRQIAGWMREARLQSREHLLEGGVQRFPEALNMLFSGDNFGKLVLKVAP